MPRTYKLLILIVLLALMVFLYSGVVDLRRRRQIVQRMKMK